MKKSKTKCKIDQKNSRYPYWYIFAKMIRAIELNGKWDGKNYYTKMRRKQNIIITFGGHYCAEVNIQKSSRIKVISNDQLPSSNGFILILEAYFKHTWISIFKIFIRIC